MPDRSQMLTRQPRPEDLISLAEAGRFLTVHAETVRRYIREGKLTGYRLAGGKTIRVRRGDVQALIVPITTTATVEEL